MVAGRAARHGLAIWTRDFGTKAGPRRRGGRRGPRRLEEITLEGRIVMQTIDRYTGCLRQTVLPAFGDLLIDELTVGRLDRFLNALAKAKPSHARNAKVVLKQMLSMAVRHGAIVANPVREVGQLPRTRRPINALTLDELGTIRTAIKNRQRRRTTGPRRNGNLADIVELLSPPAPASARSWPCGGRTSSLTTTARPRRSAKRSSLSRDKASRGMSARGPTPVPTVILPDLWSTCSGGASMIVYTRFVAIEASMLSSRAATTLGSRHTMLAGNGGKCEKSRIELGNAAPLP